MKKLILLSLLLVSAPLFASDFVMKTPTVKVAENEWPYFRDDLSFKDLNLAIDRQLKSFRRFPLKGKIILDGNEYPMTIIGESLKTFREIVKKAEECRNEKKWFKDRCYKSFNNELRKEFNLYKPVSDDGSEDVHFTGYYSPTLKGSKVRTDEYRFGIYELPGTDELRRTSREAIMFDDALENKGLEIIYVKSPYDLYLAHVEGGLRAEFVESGKTINLSFEGHNSKPFRWISKYMVDQGMIRNTSVNSQRNYIERNPEDWRDIFSYCESYVYFSESAHDPAGLNDIPLTQNRSMAQDIKHYPKKGLIGFVSSKRPVRRNGRVTYRSFSRFYIDQDTGSRILGGARADLYFGFGDEGKLGANYMNKEGSLFYLIKKNSL